MFKWMKRSKEENEKVVDILRNASTEMKAVREGGQQDQQEHKAIMDEIYARAEKFMNEKYSDPLSDIEIEQLYDLLQRAKRDDRFKDKLAKWDIWPITYETIMIHGKKIDEILDRKLDKKLEEVAQ